MRLVPTQRTLKDLAVVAWRLGPSALLALLLGFSTVVGLAQIVAWLIRLIV